MSSSISRESFQEAKNYLGVHFQQGRPILDADLNEAQAVLRSAVRRFARDSAGDGSPNEGFAIEQLFPPLRRPNPLDDPRRTLRSPEEYTSEPLDYGLQYVFDRASFFLTVPGDLLEDFESDGFTASQGRVRVSQDRPYRGAGFLRVSGHTGPVTISRRLDSPRDLSEFDVATFRYRLNRPTAGIIRFFLEDDDGHRTVLPCQTPLTFPADTWLAGVATLLDARFHIHTSVLPVARVDWSYSELVFAYGATSPVKWSVSGPPGLTIASAASDQSWDSARISFTPTEVDVFPVDITAVDGDGRSTTRSLSITVLEHVEGSALNASDPYQVIGQSWKNAADIVTPTGVAADVTAIRRYGFELYQADEPLVWDLDDLRLGGADLQARRGENNFVIRGSELAKHVRRAALVSTMRDENGGYLRTSINRPAFAALNGDLSLLQERLDSELVTASRAADGAGRFHLAGLPCVQAEDILYSDQADPNDPPLTPPEAGQSRRDEVYLDAWTEPATYVQDPAIREVALGGPDTSTRERVRHRVRVAQGGRTPTGDGTGSGTLATEGTYTAAANRLYRVEIDGPGDIGTATFRWSHENASVIARVIEPVPPGSTVVVVEDASAYGAGDLVLLRKEFGAERHQVSQVTGNEITLAAPTGDQLGQLPGAATPDFTTFALTDRPMLQRWDGFGRTITADPDDETVSASIPLDDGVRVRFGGHGMRSGDFWTFTARHLPGDEGTGTDAATRIERLAFARPRGVRHHYAPLAAFTRRGEAPDRARITDIEDRRAVLGSSMRTFKLLPVRLNGNEPVHIGGIRLPFSAREREYLVFLSGYLRFHHSVLFVEVAFYTDEMTDPQASPATGRILTRRVVANPMGSEQPSSRTTLTFPVVDRDFGSAPSAAPPTSVQFFLVGLSGDTDAEAELTAAVLVTH